MRAVTLLLALLWASSASATTFYASKTSNTPAGSDARSCATAQSASTPKATIAGGIACLSTAGDTLLVRGGSYADALTSVPSGASWGAPMRIAAYPGETVWMAPTANYVLILSSGQYIEFDGINMDGRGTVYGPVALIGSSNHIRIQHAEIIGSPTAGNCANICGAEASEFINLVVHGGGVGGGCGTPCGNAGIYTGGSNNLIDGCEIYDVSLEGIQIYNGTASNNIIRNNRIHDIIRSGDANPGARITGILIASGSSNLVYNNLVYNNGRSDGASQNSGIDVYGGSTSGTKIWNNTIYANWHYGIVIDSGVPGTEVKNNITYGNHSSDTLLDNGSGTTAGTNLEGSDPLFANVLASDFSLQASSPARNVGATLSAVLVDFVGTARPQGGTYDIGAYEFADADTPATGTVFVSDAFTGPSGLNLVTGGHMADIGGPWGVQNGSTAGMVISSANRLRGGTIDVDTFSYVAGLPVSAEYDVNASIHTFTSVSTHAFLVLGRMLSSERTGYYGIYNLSPGTLTLAVVSNYDETILGACAPNFADGSDHTVRLELRDDVKKLYYDSTFCASSTDNSVTAAGRAGVGIYAGTVPATDSTSFHISDIEGRDVQTGSLMTSCTVCRLRWGR